MPKKPAKNAFYYYMQHFKEEQKKKGIIYNNMAEVAEAAGPVWQSAPPSVRSTFEEKARQVKQKLNIDKKYTSHGVPLSEIERQEKEVRDIEEAERQDIKNIVKLKSFNGAILDEDFYIIDVNYFCKTTTHYLMAESTVLRFNLREGIIDQYHEIINPGKIPVGYAFDVKQGGLEIGFEMPDETKKKSNYIQILANIIDYLQQKDPSAKTIAPLFTMPDKVAPVQDFIAQMCNSAAEDDSIFRIYKLDTLFFTLINAMKTQENDGFPRESLALAQLKKDTFRYSPGLACETHEAADKSPECSQSRARRWAFTLLDACCLRVGIPLQPGRHVPPSLDLDSILTIKEQTKVRAGPSVASDRHISFAAASSNASIVSNSSVASDLNRSVEMKNFKDIPKKEKRVYGPVRMPKTNLSGAYPTAPALTEEEFPALVPGRGRGRGLLGSFNNMNINQ